MTVRELIEKLQEYDPDMPVGILYDMQMGFYRAHEVVLSMEEQSFEFVGPGQLRKRTEGTQYVCVCDRA